MPRFDTAQVRSYYDRHTSEFVARGQGGQAIHRAVWGPGTRTRPEAFTYVEDQIAEQLQALVARDGLRTPHVVDLGCGTAATLCGLARRLPIQGTGITLSPVQVRLAQEQIRDAGLSDSVRCIEGDFCDLPPDVATADLAYAIESFVHGSNPEQFFTECAGIIRPGGVLMICDDFRRPATEPAAAQTIDRFCRGWHVNALLQPEELHLRARAAGFGHESTVDLTPHLELGRPRDRAIAALVALVGWLPPVAARFDHLLGGAALQTCLANGWVGYELALFRRLG